MSDLPQIVSLSGGKDSTAMLLMMLERGEDVAEAVSFDTGWEFPEMYEHLGRLREFCAQEHGFDRFTVLRPSKPFEYWMYERVKRKGDTSTTGYGWARPNARWCTKMKTDAMDAHLRRCYPEGAVQCIGIAADEPQRVRDKRYPLVEWGVTEADALAYCKAKGFDWGGLYEHRGRVSCWCCPLQGLRDLRALYDHHPELWARLLEMDSKSRNAFRRDYSAEQIDARFRAEDAQMSLEEL